MNLHAICNPIIAAINPNVAATLYVSTGSTTAADGTQVPSYATSTVQAQVQALTGKDLEQLDSLSIQGVTRAAYLTGNVEGLNRAASKGGDLLTFGGQTWLVVAVLEPWASSAGWTKVALREQVNAP